MKRDFELKKKRDLESEEGYDFIEISNWKGEIFE